MTEKSGWQLTGSAPENYERYMVPTHCLARAQDLLERVALQPLESVLDVACGTGIVSRYAAQRVGNKGKVTGIDLNPAMLEVARKVSAYCDQIEFLEGNVEDLPVGDSEFDVVLCQQALQFFPDRERAVKEMFRALKPGGRVALNAFRSAEFNPAFDHLIVALEKHVGAEAANVMRSPFSVRSVADVRSLFEKAGFKDIRVTIHVGSVRWPSVAELVRQETNSMPVPDVQTKMAEAQESLTREMSKLVESYVDDCGVVFPVQDYVAVARR